METEKQLTEVDDPVFQLLSRNKKAIESILPKHLTPERVLRLAYIAINQVPKLRDCTQQSLINCIIEVSRRGLDLGRTCHIIPFKRTATFIADYKGLIELAHRSGSIASFRFKPVYSNDEFDYQEGTEPFIIHKPIRGRGNDRGILDAAYAVVHYTNGGIDFEVVEVEDIEAVKRKAPGANLKGSPWNDPDLEWTMWCKTAVRRLAKRIPQSPDLQAVAHLDELADAGVKQTFEAQVEDADFTVKEEETKDDMKTRIEDKLTGMREPGSDDDEPTSYKGTVFDERD